MSTATRTIPQGSPRRVPSTRVSFPVAPQRATRDFDAPEGPRVCVPLLLLLVERVLVCAPAGGDAVSIARPSCAPLLLRAAGARALQGAAQAPPSEDGEAPERGSSSNGQPRGGIISSGFVKWLHGLACSANNRRSCELALKRSD